MEQAAKTGTCSKCELSKKGIIDTSQTIIFNQAASYRGGLQGFPNDSVKNGFAFILNDAFAFYDQNILWKTPYNRVVDANLDYFQPSGTRAVLAGVNARMLQETKNVLALSYVDEENVERTAKFQIHGALSIPGEAAKAKEFLNHLLEFKSKFRRKDLENLSDPTVKLEKLKRLKDQGIISEAEFDAKKRELLDQL